MAQDDPTKKPLVLPAMPLTEFEQIKHLLIEKFI